MKLEFSLTVVILTAAILGTFSPGMTQEIAPPGSALLSESIRGRHPRLLFTSGDVQALRARSQGEASGFFEDLESYVSVSKAPDHLDFLTSGTDAQRQGLWRTPTAALHYVITGDRTSFENAQGFLELFMSLEHWETGKEQDIGMGAANIMVGAALAYDWLYNDLDPDFREAFRAKLKLQAERMYRAGHLQETPGSHYWQQDPQNNHRWHRNAGLTLAALAVAGEDSEDDWLLEKVLEELEFIADWLPEDGTSHEGPSYMVFVGAHLLLAFDAADRCFGTKFLDHSFFKATVDFRLQSLTPGFDEVFCFGDCGGKGSYNNYLFACTAKHELANHQAGVMEFLQRNPKSFWIIWFSLVWWRPMDGDGRVSNLPRTRFFPDLGLAFMRDGWEEDNVAMMFKCSPYGGLKLNEYRNKNEFSFVNVAHDDPDANSFLLYADGRVLARSDGYSHRKVTSSHNTIVVNGKGQTGEGGHWTQPIDNYDMTRLAEATTWKENAAGIVIVEGEAGGAYEDLEQYRRTVIWYPGQYILVLDNIRAHVPSTIRWQIQGAEVDEVNTSEGEYRLKDGDAELDFVVAGSGRFESTIAASTADHRGKSLDYSQLQLVAKAQKWNVTSVYNSWKKEGLTLRLSQLEGGMEVVVENSTFSDDWTLEFPTELDLPSTVLGKRGERVLIKSGSEDKASFYHSGN